jgi:hypothetical protein
MFLHLFRKKLYYSTVILYRISIYVYQFITNVVFLKKLCERTFGMKEVNGLTTQQSTKPNFYEKLLVEAQTYYYYVLLFDN